MNKLYLKSVRRKVLLRLYQEYLNDPLNMLEPQDFISKGILQQDLVPATHYLHDRKLIEMLMGYTPPLFSSVRITAIGIDLVENHYLFNLQFPPEPETLDDGLEALPYLIEQLVEEADLSPVNGIVRQRLLTDVQYLRDELARPVPYWRKDTLISVLDWIERAVPQTQDVLPSLKKIRDCLEPLDT